MNNNKNLNWMRFNKYLYKYWRLEATIIFLGLVTVPLGLVNPYLTKLVIDKAYGNRDLRLFLILAAISGSSFVLSSLLNYLNDYLSQRINHKVHFDISKDLFKHLQSLPLSFFNDETTGGHIYRITGDVASVSSFVCGVLPQIITLSGRLLFLLVIVFYLNWKLALFAVLLAPFSYIQPYFFGKWLREITRRMIEKSQGIFEELTETFSHIHLVKAMGKEEYEIKRFLENLTKRIDFEFKNAKLLRIRSLSDSVLNKIITGVIGLCGGYQLIRGTMTLGSLSAVMLYLIQLIGIIKSIGSFYESVAINSVSCERLSDIMDVRPEIQDPKGAIDYRILRGRIEYRDVSFGYKEDELIIKDINFSIEPASKIALVGPSGCGKTTLLSLILRLYDIKGGIISIDGLSINDIKLKALRAQVGIVLQESFLWNDTIANNILYGAENATHEDMVKAAKLAEAHEFIMALQDKYDSRIGEMACKISEGQKQRIAIARTLIKKPRILILDEAMASLDSETEDRIIDNIKRELWQSTVLLVSHRLSAVKKMDLVYFFETPSLISTGSHEEHTERSRRYRDLFGSQISMVSEMEGMIKSKPIWIQ